jgi:hypothetical protein
VGAGGAGRGSDGARVGACGSADHKRWCCATGASAGRAASTPEAASATRRKQDTSGRGDARGACELPSRQQTEQEKRDRSGEGARPKPNRWRCEAPALQKRSGAARGSRDGDAYRSRSGCRLAGFTVQVAAVGAPEHAGLMEPLAEIEYVAGCPAATVCESPPGAESGGVGEGAPPVPVKLMISGRPEKRSFWLRSCLSCVAGCSADANLPQRKSASIARLRRRKMRAF